MSIYEFILSGILWGVIWAFVLTGVDFYQESRRK